MKYCPTCDTRYDEEILRFCMKDGTPLIDEAEPNFVEMPSESLAETEDESDDITVIRTNRPSPPTPPPGFDDEDFSNDPVPSQRIIVPMGAAAPRPATPRPPAQYQAPPKKPNTFLIVILTMLGTTALLAVGAIGFWFVSSRSGTANINLNTNLANENLNVNTSLGIDSNFNFNTDANLDSSVGVNLNANTRTPTPTPTPSPTETPTPRPTPTATPVPTETPTPQPTPTATRTPFPTPLPTIIRPGQSPTPRPTESPSASYDHSRARRTASRGSTTPQP